MTPLNRLATLPPAGTRCFYQNEALKLEGWGVITQPRDDIDADLMPGLVPWRGALSGPVDPTQRFLDQLVPGCGVLPGEDRYLMAPRTLLFLPTED